MTLSAEEWLANEDKQCWDERLNRLKWTMEKCPDINVSLFHGGFMHPNELLEKDAETVLKATFRLMVKFSW